MRGMSGDPVLPTTALYEQMERRRIELGLRPEGIVHPKTRAKIRDGEPIRADVYERLDRQLRWQIGSAERVARGEGEPVELDNPDFNAERRLRIVSTTSAVATVGDISEEDLREIEALADAIGRILDRRNRR